MTLLDGRTIQGSMPRWREDRRERLHDLLGALGNSKITVDQFWRYMRAAGLDDSDIDQYCAEEARWSPE